VPSASGPLCYVGVHHKTGTVWMKQVYASIARRLELPLIELARPPRSSTARGSDIQAQQREFLVSTLQPIRTQGQGIVFDKHSMFSEIPRRIRAMRGVHVIRDPRDVLISATFYHVDSFETWLHRPRPDLDGMTYQGKLRSMGSIREALLFELTHQTRRVVHEMVGFPRMASVPTFTYESLMAGDVLAAFEKMFVALGFSERAKRVALECAEKESIVLNPERRGRPHIRSGKPRQWDETFDRALGEQFAEVAGAQLITLGYESDQSWLRGLPASRPALDEPLPVRNVSQ
jgi:hypothetical protein